MEYLIITAIALNVISIILGVWFYLKIEDEIQSINISQTFRNAADIIRQDKNERKEAARHTGYIKPNHENIHIIDGNTAAGSKIPYQKPCILAADHIEPICCRYSKLVIMPQEACKKEDA